MNLGEKENRGLRPDAQAFDEVRIVTVPRYKTSGMSGDEWRISARIELYRKGNLIHSESYRNVETACIFAAATYLRAIDDGKAYFAGEGDTCDQEGCAKNSSVTYRVKKSFCRDGHESDFPWRTIRKFCAEHARRGDCALEDADRNYELVEDNVCTQPKN